MDEKCAICGKAGVNSRRGKLVTDHCHKTGFVRGKLCRSCNTGLGMFQESAELLELAIQYLKAPPTEEVYMAHKPKHSYGPFALISRRKKRQERLQAGVVGMQKRKKFCWELP